MHRTFAVYLWSLVMLVLLAVVSPVLGSSVCFSTHTSGSGSTLMKICISNHGNLQHFETPAGDIHLGPPERLSAYGEGYTLCSQGNPVRHGWDAGFDDTEGEIEGGFGAPTIYQPNGRNTFPLEITRTTTDGIFRLKQAFEWDTKEKDVTITITLTNRSSASRTDVRLIRYFVWQFSPQAPVRFARTVDSVWGWIDGTGRGLMLSALAATVPHSLAAEPFDDWYRSLHNQSCTIPGYPTPTAPEDPGDLVDVGYLTYHFGSFTPGQSKSAKVLYRRF